MTEHKIVEMSKNQVESLTAKDIHDARIAADKPVTLTEKELPENPIATARDMMNLAAKEGDIKPSEGITVDGDKLLKFIACVQDMGKILEQINVWDIKEAFIKGKEMRCITDVIATHSKWREAMKEIGIAMKADLKNQEWTVAQSKLVIATLKEFAHVHKQIDLLNIALERFVDLCDRLEAHRKTGVLEAVKEITCR